jgi:hypothetical protein
MVVNVTELMDSKKQEQLPKKTFLFSARKRSSNMSHPKSRVKLSAVVLGLSSFTLVAVSHVSEADAAAVTFTGSDSFGRAASATFDTSGTNFLVTLTNTSSADVLVPTDVLTGVFFNLSGDPSLRRTSAVLASGSTVSYDSDGQPAGGVVGGEWAYNADVSSDSLRGVNQGISASGLGIFGRSNRFAGANLADNENVGGLDYGILSAGDNSATGNGGVTGSGGLIRNSVVFTLSGLPTGFNPLTSVSNVFFQYGTNLSEPRIAGTATSTPNLNSQSVPEPSTMAGLLLTGLAAVRSRSKRKQNNR